MILEKKSIMKKIEKKISKSVKDIGEKLNFIIGIGFFSSKT